MNRRIRKKAAIRKCRKHLEEAKRIWADTADEEFMKGLEEMFARRIATIRKGDMSVWKP